MIWSAQRLTAGRVFVCALLVSTFVVVYSAPAPAPAAPLAALTTAAPTPGTQIGSVQLGIPCTSGIGVGVGFDGSNLWYSCWNQSPDLFRASPTTGHVSASYDIAGGIGAIAYDTKDNVIFAGYGGSNRGNIYKIALDANKNVVSSSLIFNTCAYSCATDIDDGLTYDAGTDTLYFSPDTSTTIWHLSTSGSVLGSFPWVGTSCYNSGLAIGDQLLFEGADGCTTIWVVDKASPTTLGFSFPTGGTRDEGLACDDTTFGQDAIWSKDAYTPEAFAFAIPAGSCGVGGEPARPSRIVELLHGYNGNFRDVQGGIGGSVTANLNNLLSQNGFATSAFSYYQDLGYFDATTRSCDPSMPAPDTNYGPLHLNTTGNGVISQTVCDSQSAAALDAAALRDQLAAVSTQNPGIPIAIVAHSMGAAVTRGYLALVQSGSASLDGVDTVFTIAGAQQGSWLPTLTGPLVSNPIVAPILRKIQSVAFTNSPYDPQRPAFGDLAAQSDWYYSVNPVFPPPPNLNYYNLYGNVQAQFQFSVNLLFWSHSWTVGSVDTGDGVMLAGSDDPSATPALGGARFLLPGGSPVNNHEYEAVSIDPINLDGVALSAVVALAATLASEGAAAGPAIELVLEQLGGQVADFVQRYAGLGVTHWNLQKHLGDGQVSVPSCVNGNKAQTPNDVILSALENPAHACA